MGEKVSAISEHEVGPICISKNLEAPFGSSTLADVGDCLCFLGGTMGVLGMCIKPEERPGSPMD